MSAISNESKGTMTTPESLGGPSPVAARRRRRIVVNSLRVGLLVVIIGGWELATRVGIIDKFFWGQPSGIWAQPVTWAADRTAQGPLWEQIPVTLEETILRFVNRVALGAFFGGLLGALQFPADVMGPQ